MTLDVGLVSKVSLILSIGYKFESSSVLKSAEYITL